MEYLQYFGECANAIVNKYDSFKPYYKWNTFNTGKYYIKPEDVRKWSFKPYYKWNTFNTSSTLYKLIGCPTCFKPYYKWNTFNTSNSCACLASIKVLNLIINGIPSILRILLILY